MKRGFVSDRDAGSTTVVADTSDHVCANCGTSAPGRYCPACGQDTRDRLPTFAQFMREATGRYLAFDGKLWKTLFPLLFRPGFLTRAYLAGKRKRFIGPARLFLISSLILFAVLRFAAESIDVLELDNAMQTEAAESAKSAKPAAKARSKAAQEDLVVIDDDLNFSMGDLPESVGGPLKKRIDRFNKLPRGQKIEQVLAGGTRYGPYAMFVLLPAFAALLKIAYLGRRRRYPGRPRLYGEHLVFAAHNHAFLFVVGILLFTVPVNLVRQLIALWIFVYLAWSMRAVYGGSWFGIGVRGFALSVVYFVLLTFVTIGLLVVAILLR
jgi:hypothetical protein